MNFDFIITYIFNNKLFFSIVFINSFVLLACIIIDLLRRFLQKNCEVKICINNGAKKIAYYSGSNLLSGLVSNKIFLPSACGGKGTCGLCKIKIINETTSPNAIENSILDYFEIKNGYRLACQFKLRKDTFIEIDEKYFEIEEYLSKVQEIENLNENVKKITLKIVSPSKIRFRAGQYIQVLYSKSHTDYTTFPDDPILRAYSIYNTPNIGGNDIIQIVVKKVENGLVSNWLHNLKVNEEVLFIGPYGDFYFEIDFGNELYKTKLEGIHDIVTDEIEASKGRTENATKEKEIMPNEYKFNEYKNVKNIIDIVFVAGGVGIVPIRSIISNIFSNWFCIDNNNRFTQNLTHKYPIRVFLFYGARNAFSLIDHDYFCNLAKEYKDYFYYFPTIEIKLNLEEAKVNDYENKIYSGLITEVFENNFKILNNNITKAFVCGPPEMVQKIIKIMIAKGILEKDIKYDKF